MSADDSKPTGGERSRRPEKGDGYGEAFQEGIAEANFFVKQGLYAEAIGALEELRQIHGEDPRILGRLHTARTKLRQSSETAAEPGPAAVPPNLTPPPVKAQPKPKLTPPPVKAQPKPNLTPPPVKAQPKPKLTPPPVKAQPKPKLTPPPVKAQPKPKLTPPPVKAQPKPKLTPPPVKAQPKPKLTPPPVKAQPKPVVQPIPPAEPVAPPEPEIAPPPPPPAEPLPSLSESLEGSPLSPFEPKRTQLAPDRSHRSTGRAKMLAVLGGVLLLIAVVVVLIVLLRGGPRDTSDKAGDPRTVSSKGDSGKRPVGRRTPPPRRLAVEAGSGSMSAMARTSGEEDGGSGVATGRTPEPAKGDDPGVPDREPDTAGDHKTDAKRKVRLRLTIAPKSADAVIQFRGGKYITNRFVSKKVKPRSTEEEITITARGYLKMELKLTLDRDLERTVKLKRKARRMRLFDLGSK